MATDTTHIIASNGRVQGQALHEPAGVKKKEYSELEALQLYNNLDTYGASSNKILNACYDLVAIVATIRHLKNQDTEHATRVEMSRAIIELKYKIVRLDYPPSVAENLCLLFAIVIDEFILTSAWAGNKDWSDRTLVADLFGFRDGGDRFYEVAEKALMQPNLLKDFLEIVYFFLKLGYLGRYETENEQERDLLIVRIETALRIDSNNFKNVTFGRPARTYKTPRTNIGFFSKLLFCIMCVLFSYSFYVFQNNKHEDNEMSSYNDFSKIAVQKENAFFVYSSKDRKTRKVRPQDYMP